MVSSARSLRRLLVASVLAVAVLLVGSVAAQAATFTVNTTADNAPGSAECSGAAGDCGLRQAIDKANTTAGDDTVSLPAGDYKLTITGAGEDANQTGDLDIENNGVLTLTGAGARSTTIDASGIGERAVQVLTDSTASISGVTVTGGVESSGNYFNTGGGGGGIENDGTLTLTDSTVSGNVAQGGDPGGGIYSSSDATALTLTRDTIVNNKSSGDGGGLDVDAGTLTVSDSTIANNVVDTTLPGTPGYYHEYGGGRRDRHAWRGPVHEHDGRGQPAQPRRSDRLRWRV